MRKIWRIIKFIILFLVSLIAAAVVINTGSITFLGVRT